MIKRPQQEVRIERTFYSNGQLRSETPYVGDQINGVIRRWHENGVLESEIPKVNSVDHGTMRQWDSGGRLVAQCDYEHGVGLCRTWYDNGQLKSETLVKNGVPHGRMRAWDEGGEILAEQFFVAGHRVSKKKYLESCAKDPSLPKYDFERLETALMDRNAEVPVDSSVFQEAEIGDARDALEWLRGSTDKCSRTLGELSSTEESIELVQEFLANGATSVLAVHIHSDEDGFQNTGHLVVELPSDPSTREQALEYCNEQNQLLGLSRTKDSGQRYVHVALD